jgi:adenylate cyclase
LLREALAASDDALAGVSSVADFDHQFLGYKVEHWIMGLRGRILVRLGRFDEARRCFDRILVIEPAMIDPTVQFIANQGYVDLAWCVGDAGMAIAHAQRIVDLATRQASPYLRAYSLACMGIAHGVAGNYRAAIQSLSEGIDFVRAARVAMEIEPEMLASIAEYQLRSGAREVSIEKAKEAIDLAKDRHTRLPECRATITLAVAYAASEDSDRSDEVAKLVGRAEAAIETTGASIYRRLLEEARRQLSLGA